MVGQNLNRALISQQYSLLLKFIEVAKAREAFLGKRKELNIIHGAASLADQEGVSLQEKLVAADGVVITSLFIN